MTSAIEITDSTAVLVVTAMALIYAELFALALGNNLSGCMRVSCWLSVPLAAIASAVCFRHTQFIISVPGENAVPVFVIRVAHQGGLSLSWFETFCQLLIAAVLIQVVITEFSNARVPIVDDVAIKDLFETVKRRVRVKRARLVWGNNDSTLSVTGCLVPTIFLPRVIRDLDRRELEIPLIHELGHVRCSHHRAPLLFLIALVLTPANVLLVWPYLRFRRDAEFAADDFVLRYAAPSEYARVINSVVAELQAVRALKRKFTAFGHTLISFCPSVSLRMTRARDAWTDHRITTPWLLTAICILYMSAALLPTGTPNTVRFTRVGDPPVFSLPPKPKFHWLYLLMPRPEGLFSDIFARALGGKDELLFTVTNIPG